jgi:hypothetical protein
MLYDVIEVKTLEDYKIYIRFENGVSGKIDISKIVSFKGIFAKLKDKKYFATVSVNRDVGTICWKNGADIAPCRLYSIVLKQDKK